MLDNESLIIIIAVLALIIIGVIRYNRGMRWL